jgi:hypothetical protein
MEMAMWGKLGRMGESIFRRRTAEVERQFVDAFTLACEAEPPREGPPVAVRHRAATTSTAPPASRRPPSWWRRVLAWFTPSSRGGRR